MSLHYNQLTPESSDNKPALVLIHGLFGSLDNLNTLGRSLTDDFSVISVDLPNHGRSPRQDNATLASMADSLLSLADSLALETFSIVGHSLGGKVAMTTAARAPDKIKKLVVADIAPVNYEPRHNQIIAGLEHLNSLEITDRKHADQELSAWVKEPGTRQFLLKSLVRNEDKRWELLFDVTRIKSAYPELLKSGLEEHDQFHGQTLFIKGANSDYLTSAHQATVIKHFPQSRAKIIHGAGHWLHAEKPAAFNKIVASFLKS